MPTYRNNPTDYKRLTLKIAPGAVCKLSPVKDLFGHKNWYSVYVKDEIISTATSPRYAWHRAHDRLWQEARNTKS